MKICGIICEYNPFHNGHKYLIERAKAISGCDAVLCIMSASFTQRGEAAVLPKFLRAEHAVLGGTDCVIQLPAAFSVAPAEVFAEGAVSILSAIPEVCCLAFGCEKADKEDILKAAKILSGEQYNARLKACLAGGESYKRAAVRALEECGGNAELISSPNGVLAVRYACSVLSRGGQIDILPIERIGGGYSDEKLYSDFSSASAIRAHINEQSALKNVPGFVAEALSQVDTACAKERWDAVARYALISGGDKLKDVFGCSEGLENKLRGLRNRPSEEIIFECTARRYTSSRIRRILAANALELYAADAKKYIEHGTYIKPLAVRESMKDKIFAALGKSALPLIVSMSDTRSLDDTARRCYLSYCLADEVRADVFNTPCEYEYTVKIVP